MDKFDVMGVNRIQAERIKELGEQNRILVNALHDAKALLLFWIERNGYHANDFDDMVTMRDINKLLASVDEET